MKRNAVIVGLACVLAAGAAGLRAQSTSGEKVKQAVQDAKEDARETKADFEKRVKADLKELDAKIDQLGKKMSAMGEDGRKKAKAEATMRRSPGGRGGDTGRQADREGPGPSRPAGRLPAAGPRAQPSCGAC